MINVLNIWVLVKNDLIFSFNMTMNLFKYLIKYRLVQKNNDKIK